MSASKQRTLKTAVHFDGIGLHTGEKVRLSVLPAPENHGYKFQRVDLENQPIIPADCDLVVGTQRGTTLELNGARVYTTEHILAAIYGCKIDNALIQVNAPEIPIMDGSSAPFVQAFEEVGYEEQQADRKYLELTENITFEDNEKHVEMLAVPTDGGEFRLTVMVDYNSPVLGTQHASMYSLEEFIPSISQCRTFVFLKEIKFLAENGLIKGGDLDNAIVLAERKYEQAELKEIAGLVGKAHDDIKVEGMGVLNTIKLKFENEPARHKLLDIVGDLALVGRFIRGHILAARPGHAGNVAFAKVLKGLIKNEKNAGYFVDLNKEPLYDINQIMAMLPHRYPFLLVDKVMEMDDKGIVAVKNVTLNEPHFTGHFPNNPVFPGVLQIEAMAQAGGIFALSSVPDPENYSTYFMKIDAVKFKQKVLPGDTMVLKLTLESPIRRGLVHMSGKIYVAGKVVSEAEMLAQIVKDKKTNSCSLQMISNQAHVSPNAKIGKNVSIGPFTTIYDDVEIGENTWIGPNVTIMDGARIGTDCKIFPGAVISAIPQDLKYAGEKTTAVIGNHTTIRECVTINKGTTDRMVTEVGDHCLLMAYVHVAHDVSIGNHCIIANTANIAGHVIIEDWVVIEGVVAIQQFVRIGQHAFLAGGSLVRKNVPPFVKAAREPVSFVGVNSIGLRRRGFEIESISHIEDIYRTLYVHNTNLSEAIKIADVELPQTKEKATVLNFIRESDKGIIRGPQSSS